MTRLFMLIRFSWRPAAGIGLLLAMFLIPLQAADSSRWEEDIAAFEKQDAEKMPEPGGLLFVGSSSIRMWKLDEFFPGMNAINRGFGGSEMADSVHFFDRIVAPHKPRVIFVYAGDNDISNGKNPERVLADFKEFTARANETLPETKVVFIAIKPSLARWKLADQMRRANDLVREFTRQSPRLKFLDIWSPMLGVDGKPRADLLIDDELHLSEKGYALWSGMAWEKLLTLEAVQN